MIEGMIVETKKYLPLKISTITWDRAILFICGTNWNFATFSAWRVSEKNKLIFGCNDKNSEELLQLLKNFEIVDLNFQICSLKIDPVFFLSNGQRIEVFSSDIFEPWTFEIEGLGFYNATPNVPSDFDSNH